MAAAQRGVAVSDSLSTAHIALGLVYLGQKQYEPALAEMERAITLDPTLATSYAMLADTLSHVGRSEEALRMVE